MPERKRTADAKNPKEAIVIDEANGLVFQDEDELYSHFLNEIQFLEESFLKWRRPDQDIDENTYEEYESYLTKTLEEPDEVWEDTAWMPETTFTIYVRRFEKEFNGDDLYYVAVVHLTDGIPSFVYLHFPTIDNELVQRYQRGDLVYDEAIKNAPPGALEGDALLEGDQLATGLYKAMLKVRSPKDIPEVSFKEHSELREESIEEADEIWRANDSVGNILVTFIKDFSHKKEKELHYIVVTLEDTPSNTHSLLFSFPTSDKNLLSRYRHGENLQAEEVVQEASH